jgi:hypothetical protein
MNDFNDFLKTQIEIVTKMTSRERMVKLCELAAKEHFGTILPHEIVQLETIQTIRKENGEIDKVLKNWEENPELDPRK